MLRKVLAVAVIFAFPLIASATPKFAKDTKKACVTCHARAGKPELNDVGKCFKASKHEIAKLADCEKKAKK